MSMPSAAARLEAAKSRTAASGTTYRHLHKNHTELITWPGMHSDLADAQKVLCVHGSGGVRDLSGAVGVQGR